MTASSPTFTVQPGAAIGSFEIGMALNKCIDNLRTMDVLHRPDVEVLYDTEQPLAADVIIRVPELGIQLRFGSTSQRLRVIDVFDLNKASLRYLDSLVFCGPGLESGEGSTSLLQLYKLFGPTFPGRFHKELESYMLHYRGLCLRFPIPALYQHLYNSDTDLPLELPDGSSPAATQLLVYGGSDLEHPTLPAPKPAYLGEKIVVDLSEMSNNGTSAQSPRVTVTFPRVNKVFSLGDSVQDVLTEIGPPSDTFFREEDKMKIHSGIGGNIGVSNGSVGHINGLEHENGSRVVNAAGACFQTRDYFLNYFGLGFDLLVDGNTSTIRKLVVRTNVPGHPEFAHYNKCNFELVFSKSADLGDNGANGDVVKVIGPDMEWRKVESLLGDSGRPMVNGNGIVSNPFESTLLYAYKGCVFDVLRNGHIASATVFIPEV